MQTHCNKRLHSRVICGDIIGKVAAVNGIDLRLKNGNSWIPCHSCNTLNRKGGSRGRRTRHMRPKKRNGTYHRRR